MAEGPRTELSRDIGVFTITMVGVGAMIGAGIFVLTGIAAGTAGPALVLVFAANGLVTLLTAMAYAELGSAIPEAGGGYLWVKQGLPGPNAFLAGWMSWFAHAVAGSLYALGFGSYVGLVMDELGWTLLGRTGSELEKPLAVAVALAFVGINFKGVSETGLVGNVVTGAKILVILVFIGSGLWTMFGEPTSWGHFTPLLPTGLGGVVTAMGLTYVAFEGYEIIVQAGEEVKDPKRNIPRAVFGSLAIVIPIYLLVAVVAVGAVQTPDGQATWQWLGEHQELGLAEAARQFMPLGSTLLLVGGVLSTMSALNATTFSSTRVSFAMGRDRNLPDFFAAVHERTRTPHLALLASGTLVVFMALALPIEEVAAAADVMFLLLFLQVNVAIITIRRKYGDKLDYGFLIPFFPAIPLISIVLMLGIAVFMFRFSPTAWYYVAGWIAVGLVLYALYARPRQRAKEAPPLVLETPSANDEGYRVLVPIGHAEDIEPLVTLAATVAKARDGHLVLLHTIEIPSPTPLAVGRRYLQRATESILDPALDLAARSGVDASAVVRISRSPAKAIVFEVEERDADLLVMAWRGFRDHPRAALDRGIDFVMRNADCDIAVLRAEDLKDIRTLLLPVAMPEQGRFMLELARILADSWDGRLTLFHAVPTGLSPEDRAERLQELRSALDEKGPSGEDGGNGGTSLGGRPVILEDEDRVAERIVKLSRDYDLTVLGATREGWLRKRVAGSVPERIARARTGRILLLKDRRHAVHSVVLDTVEFFRGRGDSDDVLEGDT